MESNLAIALDQVDVRGKSKVKLMEKALEEVGLHGFFNAMSMNVLVVSSSALL